MPTSNSKKPEVVELSAEQANALKERIEANTLSEADKKLICGVISFTLWLQQQLSAAKLSIRRLKSFFNIKTEKKACKN